MIVSFVFFLVCFTLIGVSSAVKSNKSKQDYYLASSSVSPWLVGLSAVATNNSGYMFIGVIGYTYVTGLASIWLMLGWIVGDFIASLAIHKRLHQARELTGEVTYAGVLSHWYGNNQQILQRVIGAISLLFLLAYAAAQLVAGSKALYVLLDWPLWSGAMMGAVLVAAYCLAGGIRASIWTDAAQSVVMIIAMCALLWVSLMHFGGVQQSLLSMNSIEGFMAWVPSDLPLPGLFGGALFILGWMFAGFSVAGQPHIMVRFMTLNKTSEMFKAKCWYYLWFSIFYSVTTCVGLFSRLFFPEVGSFDSELALPMMAQQVMPPIMVGLILAGIFAATMSTADSLILSCSSAITHDLLPSKIEHIWLLKLVTIIVVGLTLLVALSNNQNVFNLVILAWSGLASAFVPLLIFLCLNQRPPQHISIVAVILGLLTALGWRWLGWHSWIYEGVPGILAGLLLLYVATIARGYFTSQFSMKK